MSDGSKFNLKDANQNCYNNCELYLPEKGCLFCSEGFLVNFDG